MVRLKCVSSEDDSWFTEGLTYVVDNYGKNSPLVWCNLDTEYYIEECPVGWAVCGYDVTFVEVDDGF